MRMAFERSFFAMAASSSKTLYSLLMPMYFSISSSSIFFLLPEVYGQFVNFICNPAQVVANMFFKQADGFWLYAVSFGS